MILPISIRMRKNKTLLFVTYQYPFLPGEYFIEEEIKYLARSFDRVIIFPSRSLFWQPGKVRELPDGVELWNGRDVPSILRGVWYLFSCVQAPFWIKQQNTQWQGNPDCQTVAYSSAFKAAIKTLMASRALAWFARKSKLPEQAAGYAYWRNFSAAGLAVTGDLLGLRKLYVRCHRIDIYSPFRWPTEAIIHAKSDGVFSVSSDGKDYLERAKGLPCHNIEVHRLGVRIPDTCSKASRDGVYRVLSCSNLIPVKRVDMIAQVIAQLPFPVEWTHIGDGAEQDTIEAIVAGYAADHVAVFQGRLSNQQVYVYYQKFSVDLFINLSESEGVPVSIMEALAHGVPVVATDVGGTGEIIDDTVGELVPVDADCASIVQSVMKLKERELAGVELRVAARSRAEQMCSSDRNYTEFCEHLLR